MSKIISNKYCALSTCGNYTASVLLTILLKEEDFFLNGWRWALKMYTKSDDTIYVYMYVPNRKPFPWRRRKSHSLQKWSYKRIWSNKLINGLCSIFELLLLATFKWFFVKTICNRTKSWELKVFMFMWWHESSCYNQLC